VVSRKAAPRAVDRNAVRRLVRERFRCMLPRLPKMDFVFRLREMPLHVGRRCAHHDLERLLAVFVV
jgi:ribonuclease P protein component